MSEHIKTEYEIAVEFDDLKIKSDKKWVSLDWLEEQVKKRRDMFKGLGDISELSWVLKLLEMEEKQLVRGNMKWQGLFSCLIGYVFKYRGKGFEPLDQSKLGL